MKTAVLLLAYGTPETPEFVVPYYTHIRGGRPPSEEKADELRHRYEAVGGRTPLTALTAAVRDGVAAGLAAAGHDVPVYVGMKHWTPWIHEAVAEMKADGVERVVCVVLAPHYSRFSVGGYQRYLFEGMAKHAVRFQVDFVEQWYDDPAYVDVMATLVRDELAHWPADRRDDVTVVFSAHSLPERIRTWGDPYEAQLEASARLVTAHAGLRGYRRAWQSAGQTGEPWIGPDILDFLPELRDEGVRDVLQVPIGFVCDHLEILYDLDIEAAPRRRSWASRTAARGCPTRAPTSCRRSSASARAPSRARGRYASTRRPRRRAAGRSSRGRVAHPRRGGARGAGRGVRRGGPVSAAAAGAGTLRIGTRGSALALAQARQTEALLRRALARAPHRGAGDHHHGRRAHRRAARGDRRARRVRGRDRARARARRGGRGRALEQGPAVDAGPRVRARRVPAARGPARRAVHARAAARELPHGALVGTSSPRRACQLRARRPDLRVEDIRGNVDTRLRKLDEGQYDAILLAAAGLHRLGLAHRITEYLAPEVMLPQVGQGAVGLEVRAGDARALAHVAPLDDPRTRLAVEAERAFLARLGAGCTAPAGAHASLADDGATLVVEGMIGAPDGSRVVRLAREGSAARGPALGAQVAEALMADGGLELMRAAGDRAGVA
jgi:ferrochelatase